MRYFNTRILPAALSALMIMSVTEAQVTEDEPVADRIEIRSIDKLRTDLTNQDALLTILLDVVEKAEQLLEKNIDIGILLDDDVPLSDRIQMILSSSQMHSDAEMQGMEQEIAYLRAQLADMSITPPGDSTDQSTAHALDWSVDDMTIAWARIVDDTAAVAVRINDRVITLNENDKTMIDERSLSLSSITALDGGQLQIVILVAGKPVTYLH